MTQPYHVLRPQSSTPVLFICDHASHAVPQELESLGLPDDERFRHIGWDIGAARVTEHLSELFNATAVLSGVSRLVIDCNRPPGHATSICEISDGTIVPGNHGLAENCRNQRAEQWYHPYQEAIARHLSRLENQGGVAAVIAIHSFTPSMNGQARPWPVAVLWNQDDRVAAPLMAALRGQGINCGDNEPYSGRIANHTVDRHGQDHGRPHVSIEIRQDEIDTETGAKAWAERLAQALRPILSELLEHIPA